MYSSKEKAEENSLSDAGLQKLDIKVWAFSHYRCFGCILTEHGQQNLSVLILTVVPRRLFAAFYATITLIIYCCWFTTTPFAPYSTRLNAFLSCSSGVKQGRRPCLAANGEQWGKAWYNTPFDRNLIRRSHN